MKKVLMSLIVSLAFCGSIFAQSYTSHWADFNLYNFPFNAAVVAMVQIDDEFIEPDDNWAAMELAAFVDGECRGHMFMNDETDLGDPHPAAALQVYYTNAGEPVDFKLYDHANGIEYDVYTSNFPILTGDFHDELWLGDLDNAIVISFFGDEPSTGYTSTVTGGYWHVASTWLDNTVPPVDAELVTIQGPVIIAANSSVRVVNIEVVNEGSLTIEDGGELFHLNDVDLTMQMNYEGVDWMLIASPVESVAVEETGLIVGEQDETNYNDLFRFDASQPQNEWRNYWDEEGTFTELVSTEGYLYARYASTPIQFTGTAIPTVSTMIGLNVLDESSDFPGWNLIGNPFTYSVKVYSDSDLTDMAFYKVNNSGEGEAFIPFLGESIAPMEGFFLNAIDEEAGVTFSEAYVYPVTPTGGGDDMGEEEEKLTINLTKGRGDILDKAILRFDNGNALSKLQFGESRTNIYMPVNGKDYSVMRCENSGEMPLNFKAGNNGTYTLSFNTGVSFNYLHLIDNLTGNDVNLLETPSYTFDAQTTDYASRFRLVFATGNNNGNDNFAFFSNGELIINNSGNATLQVVDVTGRILSSENINGSASVHMNAAAGVYMLRLINGNDVMVQKIVVK